MVFWGVIFGAVLGLFWQQGASFDERIVTGAVLGAVAAAALRSAIRAEVRKALADRSLLPSAPAATRAITPHEPEPPEHEPPRHTPPPTHEPPGPEHPPPHPEHPTAEPDPLGALAATARDWLFGGNVVVRVGVVVLFVGLAFLAKYAIDNSLVPPQLRLAAIGAAGIALFVTGIRLRAQGSARLAYALTLQGAGIAVLYLTVFAAFRLYQFLPAAAAFGALALICAFSAAIALAQDALALAFIGFAGGFAAPILVSTGQGDPVALFSYYVLLGVAIVAIAAFKPWRALNLLGFFATFAIATAWRVLQYRPQDFATTEPFVVAFFAIYLAAALLHALRHSLASVRAVDATLVFGVPLVGFGLQAALVRGIPYAAAFSSLALGALYLALAAWMLRAKSGDATTRRWLAESFLAIGLGFTTLAVPLALDARWTSAVWAVEGAAVYWMGRRQSRLLARVAGLLLQGFAGGAYLYAESWRTASQVPFVHPAFIGAAMLAGSALWGAWQARESQEARLSPFLFWVGFLWWQFALHGEIDRTALDIDSTLRPAYSAGVRTHLALLAWVGSAFALHALALPRRRSPWPIAATPAWTVLPVMAVAAIASCFTMNPVFEHGGWIAWPIAIALHFVMLRRFDAGAPKAWWPWVHAGGVWLAVLLAGNALVDAVGRAQLWQTAWASVILLVASIAVLLVLSLKTWFTPRAQSHWPLDRFARDYLWRAALPVAVGVALGCLVVSVHSDGNARPLPYVPLLNPTDLSVALGLAACATWLARLRESQLPVPPLARGARVTLVLAGLAFVAINTVWLRVAHHYAGVEWDAIALFDSFFVQTGYSILWTLIAVMLMVAAHRTARRPVWTVGAGLLALTVAKLFIIDLSNRGGSERIVAFIAVGVLMLLVGYFAPLPPSRERLRAAQGAAP